MKYVSLEIHFQNQKYLPLLLCYFRRGQRSSAFRNAFIAEESPSAYCVPLFLEASENAMLNKPEFLLLVVCFLACLFVQWWKQTSKVF